MLIHEIHQFLRLMAYPLFVFSSLGLLFDVFVCCNKIVAVGDEQAYRFSAIVGILVECHSETRPQQQAFLMAQGGLYCDSLACTSQVQQPLIYMARKWIGLAAEGFGSLFIFGQRAVWPCCGDDDFHRPSATPPEGGNRRGQHGCEFLHHLRLLNVTKRFYGQREQPVEAF